MYAIVEIAGQQFKVAKDQKVFVHRLEEKEGSKVSFDKVLLMNDGKVTIGAPVIKDAVVTAKVLKHLKGDKVIVFKKKRRKGFKKKNGHRQFLSEIQIDGISVKAPAKKAAAKKDEAKAEKAPAAKKEAPAKKETKAPAKAAPKATAKKTAAKKPAAKKESPKK
ncbi:50S ribosomal protein L21 [Lutimonas zeaxanthinifaciens]|uniref:50S ribosomal protein L21 n=1 Tax=Lutimonas zeaxanthinifaciens TaxID=3060215 RepID=UPI00265CA433|nr:50S ribosomal protein L21 [Lutimonas sp. YSD2104]WKK66544.1 50S ribosomal protein L21 [Lutimonas sp. YSD2104]